MKLKRKSQGIPSLDKGKNSWYQHNDRQKQPQSTKKSSEWNHIKAVNLYRLAL